MKQFNLEQYLQNPNKKVVTRKGDSEWCQCCLKRRVSKGYRYCYFCSIQ
jgi:hypothetical protein